MVLLAKGIVILWRGDIMKELRRIISMLMILVLFIGILPMNLGVVKAEAERDETNKIKDIRARVYDGNKGKRLDLLQLYISKEKGKRNLSLNLILT